MVETTNNDVLSLSVRDFIARTAARSPTPGGGSIAGVTGAMATALGEMALNFTRGKKKYAEWAEYHDHLLTRIERMRGMFTELVHDDIAAYGMYAETTNMAEGPERKEKIDLALAAAVDVPLEVTKLALALLEDLLQLSDKCNPYLLSDLVAAAHLAHATVILCNLNVRINAAQIDPEPAAELRQSSSADRNRAAVLAEKIESAAGEYL